LPEPEPKPESKQRGRPREEVRSGYEAAIAYILKTHIQVKRLLLDKEEQGEKQDFSELVQELLEFWVEIQQGANPEILIAIDIQNFKI